MRQCESEHDRGTVLTLYSPAAERNKTPILATIAPYLGAASSVLEIGSGSGQHAVYCAKHLPHVTWWPSEIPQLVPQLEAALAPYDLTNLRPVLALDVRQTTWPLERVDVVFSANTLHCMSWVAACALFRASARVLAPRGVLLLYGPFNDAGRFTSAGNRALDAWARDLDSDFGLRDEQAVIAAACATGLSFVARHSLPANNLLLSWRCPPTAEVTDGTPEQIEPQHRG
jgi:cyclopropane fatty-acyl-phospholipid synthase-like methyltransferase